MQNFSSRHIDSLKVVTLHLNCDSVTGLEVGGRYNFIMPLGDFTTELLGTLEDIFRNTQMSDEAQGYFFCMLSKNIVEYRDLDYTTLLGFGLDLPGEKDRIFKQLRAIFKETDDQQS